MAVRKEKCGGSCNSAVGHEGCGKRNKSKLLFYNRLREKYRATEGDGVRLDSYWRLAFGYWLGGKQVVEEGIEQ